MTMYLAIDVGGTKTAVSVGDEAGRLHDTKRMPTEASQPPGQWRRRLNDLVQMTLDEASVSMKDIKAVGLAVPGPMHVGTGMVLAPPNMPAWQNVPVKSWVEELTRVPVHINNDANAAALAEYCFGEFRGTPDLVYLTMSTGLGAGVISGGRLVQGANDLGGEVGHMVIDADGPPCPCGHHGCWELFCGGRNLALRMQRELAGGQQASLVLEEAGGAIENIDFQVLARALRRKDGYAQRIWDDYLEHLAHGIGIVTMCYNPGVIVLGTIAIHMHELIVPYLETHIRRYAWKQACEHLVIRPSRLGTNIGDLGALALVLSEQ